jgi:hypothetical protein
MLRLAVLVTSHISNEFSTKVSLTITLSTIPTKDLELAVAFVSSAYSGGIAEILQEFRVVQIIATLGISLFVLGFAIGPLLWAPLSGECLLAIETELELLTL